MTNREDEAIASGAAHVDEVESLAAGYSQPRDSNLSAGEDDAEPPLAGVTLSMFPLGTSIRVRVGNVRNASELFELSFDSIEEANTAMLDANILTPEQVRDPRKLAGVDIPLTGITVTQLEDAGLKRQQASTL